MSTPLTQASLLTWQVRSIIPTTLHCLLLILTLFYIANQQQGIIIDENNAQEVCEKIKAKKVTALILKSKKKLTNAHKSFPSS